MIPCRIGAADFEQPQEAAHRHARDLGLADPGDSILLLAGFGKN